MVAPGDPERLASALELVLAQPALAEKMGEQNRQIAEERHSWPRVTDRLEAIYARAVATGKRRG
jgi:glycosyltransferase involved in cell wall biosynthesis